MRHKNTIIYIGIMAIILFSLSGYAASECGPGITEIYFFYSTTCPHCAEQKPLMKTISESYEDIHVHFYEVGQESDKWKEVANDYNATPAGVPMTFVGNKAFMGYTSESGELELNSLTNTYIGYQNVIIKEIESTSGINLNIDNASKSETKLSSWMIFLISLLYLLTYPFVMKKDAQAKRYWWGGLIASIIIALFIFISITPETVIKNFAQGLPFPLFVFIIAIADGFNPCAFTVLIILLSLLTYTKSRKDMMFVGSTFIITSAIMYFIFIMIMVLLGSFFIEKYGHMFMLLLGTLIVGAGAINIKDFFFFNKGVSLTLSEKQKSKITRRAGKIVKNLKKAGENKKMFFAALGGTVLLAIIVNIVELGCTAILPSVYMTTLIKSFGEKIGIMHILWTLFYSFIYIIPLFAILFNFIFSFKSARITESQGRILKLVGGLFMLFFGVLMILKPELLMFG